MAPDCRTANPGSGTNGRKRQRGVLETRLLARFRCSPTGVFSRRGEVGVLAPILAISGKNAAVGAFHGVVLAEHAQFSRSRRRQEPPAYPETPESLKSRLARSARYAGNARVACLPRSAYKASPSAAGLRNLQNLELCWSKFGAAGPEHVKALPTLPTCLAPRSQKA